MRKTTRLFGVLTSLALLCLLIAPWQAQSAGGREVIRNFESFVQIQPDGTLLVREEITVVAAHEQINHGIYRDFPLKYTGPKRYSGEVPFQLVSTSLDGEPLDVSDVQRSRGNIRILMRDKDKKLSKGEHTFVLVYATSMHVRSFENEDYDELNWNVTGDGWAFPIENAACFISLPDGAEILQTIGWTGKRGSREAPPEVERPDAATAFFVSSKPVLPGEHFTVAVSFPRGVVSEDIPEDAPAPPPDGGGSSGGDTPIRGHSFFDRMGFAYSMGDNAFDGVLNMFGVLFRSGGEFLYFLGYSLGWTGLLVLSLAYFGLTWWFFGRDPKPGTIIPLFHPPLAGYYGSTKGVSAEELRESPMSPAAVEYVKNANSLTGRGLSSLFLSLAFKGFCKLEKSGKTFTVKVLDPEKEPETASQEERDVYGGLKDGMDKQGELSISKDNASVLRSISSGVKSVLRKRYGPIWSHNSGIVLAGWLWVTPLCVHLSDGGYYDGKEVVMPMFFFCLLLFVLNRFASSKGQSVQSTIGAVLLTLVGFLAKGLVVWGGAVFLLMVGVGLFMSYTPLNPFLLLFLAPPLIFSRLMKAPSKEGRALLDKIDGLAMYINTAEKNRLAMLNAPEDSPEVFERLLPYAVALGLEKTWCDRFADQLASGMIDNSNIPEEVWTSAALSSFARELGQETQAVSTYTTGDSSGGSAFSSDSGSSSSGGSGSGSGGGGGGGL